MRNLARRTSQCRRTTQPFVESARAESFVPILDCRSSAAQKRIGNPSPTRGVHEHPDWIVSEPVNGRCMANGKIMHRFQTSSLRSTRRHRYSQLNPIRIQQSQRSRVQSIRSVRLSIRNPTLYPSTRTEWSRKETRKVGGRNGIDE